MSTATAALLGPHDLALLHQLADPIPILFLEPSCYSMVVEDYCELQLPDTESILAPCLLFEKFVDDLLEREPNALSLVRREAQVAIHAHCRAKSLLHPGFMVRLPGRKATLLDAGCCGMAGAFGMLVARVTDQPNDALVVASGTSCRHQIDERTPRRPQHRAEPLANAFDA